MSGKTDSSSVFVAFIRQNQYKDKTINCIVIALWSQTERQRRQRKRERETGISRAPMGNEGHNAGHVAAQHSVSMENGNHVARKLIAFRNQCVHTAIKSQNALNAEH